ncbi:hypothetical protein BGZ83_007710 [Gryganskiella cystojenkinii]|nr:hypothetical protein BGZ83_007710 [Gryganskiella cystojenkinii]
MFREQTGTSRTKAKTGDSTTIATTLSTDLSTPSTATSTKTVSDLSTITAPGDVTMTSDAETPVNPATAPTTGSSSSSSSTTTTPRAATGVRGPIGPRPGVYRPCARCRNKKTRCDRLKPSCSNCKKTGPDAVCVYDNDEPAVGVVTTPTGTTSTETWADYTTTTAVVGSADEENVYSPAETGSTSSSSINNSTSTNANAPSPKAAGNDRAVTGGSGSESGATAGATTTKTVATTTTAAARPSISLNNGISAPGGTSNGGGSYVRKHGSPLPDWATKKNVPEEDPSSQPPPTKKAKQNAASAKGAATPKPSPLRSSITNSTSSTKSATASPSPAPTKTPSSLQQQQEHAKGLKGSSQPSSDDNIDVDSPGVTDDRVVTGLLVAKAKAKSSLTAEDQQQLQQQQLQPQPTATKSHKKQPKITSSLFGIGGANGPMSTFGSSKIMIDLPTARPPAPFVIDGNQRARKWGRSKAVVQTLGGEVLLPLWTSDHEMLLNEARPYFIQNASLYTAGNTNLARLAAFNQLDYYNLSSNNTPERGNTPESEHSPSGLTPANPPTGKIFKKKKRSLDTTGSRKSKEDHHEGPVTTTTNTKRKQNYDIEDGGDLSSSRSTPTPSVVAPSSGPKPRAIPTRPRQFPCSFEGCGKSFMDKFHLRRHETRHVTQEIVCGIDGCTKAYDSISTMRRHQSMIHKTKKGALSASAAITRTDLVKGSKNPSDGAEDGEGDGDGDAGQEDENEEEEEEEEEDEGAGSIAEQTIAEEMEI